MRILRAAKVVTKQKLHAGKINLLNTPLFRGIWYINYITVPAGYRPPGWIVTTLARNTNFRVIVYLTVNVIIFLDQNVNSGAAPLVACFSRGAVVTKLDLFI